MGPMAGEAGAARRGAAAGGEAAASASARAESVACAQRHPTLTSQYSHLTGARARGQRQGGRGAYLLEGRCDG